MNWIAAFDAVAIFILHFYYKVLAFIIHSCYNISVR